MTYETERLYHSDSYLTHFGARVIRQYRCGDSIAVVLDRTAFYPTSGGQPHDLGKLNGVAVTDVVEEDGAVLHLLDLELVDVHVTGEVDRGRRSDHREQHTGQHILSAALSDIAGIPTHSFHLGRDLSTIDIGGQPASSEVWDEIEGYLHTVIQDHRPITSFWIEPESAVELNIRKIPDRPGPLRIVDIAGVDRTACGGTHCRTTGELTVIMILGRTLRKVHGGLYRVSFVGGARALKDYRSRIAWMGTLSGRMGVGESEINEAIDKLQDAEERAGRAARQYRERWVEGEADRIKSELGAAIGSHIASRIFTDREPDDIKLLAQTLVRLTPCIVLFGGGVNNLQLVFARHESLTVDMGRLMTGATRLIGERGGGRSSLAVGGASDLQAVAKALEWATGEVMGSGHGTP